ncbi:hypothetical protein BpHYR1_021199 [Brachionus plicatilis]|uniref:Uncharacterized protein n=1 Tax=Brachionus plicatilis TaxID=10195 RepID=A0A3M7TAK1_BRAPC|nr:hypothetical protein BpHYR1_021199 [Brachionus plicatilis]
MVHQTDHIELVKKTKDVKEGAKLLFKMLKRNINTYKLHRLKSISYFLSFSHDVNSLGKIKDMSLHHF